MRLVIPADTQSGNVDAVILQARRILFTQNRQAFECGERRDESSAMGLLRVPPVVLQDAATRDVLMVQYTTEDGLRRTLEERSMWLWSRSREEFWMAGRQSRGYDLQALRANCMGDSLLAIVDATDRAVCHLGHKSCFSQPVQGAPGGE
jgi:phosphoribosyl-AMP cyclohydrolase